MPTMNSILGTFTQKYNSVTQIQAYLADPQNLIGELGRGSGKTTEILAPRILRVAYSMPRSEMALAGPSYIFVIDNIVKGLLMYLNKHYVRGKHFEYSKEPPKWFKRPYSEVTNWKQTISFPCGTVIYFVGLDRANTSGVGRNFAHVFVDELLRISETNFTERLLPAKRADREIFGDSHYLGGVTGFSSTPNFENDFDWWLKFEQNMNPELLEEIMFVAYKVSQALAWAEIYKKKKNKAEKLNNWEVVKKIDPKIEKKLRFAARWEPRLNMKRREQTYYMKGSSFTNLVVLSLNYMKEQFMGSGKNISKFKLSILGIRPDRVENMFFSKFDKKKHIFTDSYKYNSVDLIDDAGAFKKTSRDLKYHNHNKPLLIGYDPGDFQSCVVAQEDSKKTLRIMKNFWAYLPEEHSDLARKINHFYSYQQSRVIFLYYDRAGNKHLSKYKNRMQGDTDIKILKYELEQLDWTVHLMNENQRTIFHWEHFLLFSRLLGEKESKTPKIRICQYEAEELISCIYSSPVKRTDTGQIELDKSSEKKLDFEDQVWFSTQLPTAMYYLVFGLYEKWLPQRDNGTFDIEGL